MKPRDPLTVEQRTRIVTLTADGQSPGRIAKQIGKSRHAVRNALAEPQTQAAVEAERAELAKLYREKERACVVGMDSDKIAKASLQQLAVSAGILHDKHALLTGGPTESIAVQVRSFVEAVGVYRKQRDEESERQFREAHSKLTAAECKVPGPCRIHGLRLSMPEPSYDHGPEH